MISVIVPIYNVENYLDKCIESILEQSYNNLQIILVDDGSTDGSGALCDKWSKQDSRIQVIHQQNGGLSRARNAGIAVARGQYIAFVDSDDFIHPQMYERMLKALETTGADMTICREHAFEDGKSIEKTVLSEKPAVRVEGRQELLLHFLDDFPGLVTWAWNKLYRKTLIDGLLFENGAIMEDVLFAVSVADRVTKAARLDERLYYYRQRKNSIMTCKNPERLLRCALVAEKEYYMLQDILDVRWHLKAYHIALLKIAGYAAMSYMEKEVNLKKIEAIYRELYDSVPLGKSFKVLFVRYFPKLYYLLKNR